MIKRVVSFVLAVAMGLGLVFMAPVHVHAATDMDVSKECIRYLQSMEGFTATPYWDYSQWTVGFGNRCPDADLDRYKAEGIPIEEAEALFASQLSGFVKAVNNFANRKGLTLKQQEFDALVCLAYNKGGAWMYKDNDPLVIALENGDTGNTLIAALTLSVVTSTGVYLPGLTTRRLTEANMYINGIYSTKAPGNYCHVVYDANGGTKSRTAQGYDCNLPAEPVATATYDGYTFLGWYTAPSGGTKVTALDVSHNGMTLYAQWGDGTETENPDETTTPAQTQLVTVTTSVLNVRTGPGTSYNLAGSVTKGTQVAITQVQEVEGVYWGEYHAGWICLSYTDYDPNPETETPVEPEEPETPVEPETPSDPVEEEKPVSTLPEGLPLVGTVVGTTELTVYNGPHSSYPQVGTLSEGDKVTITQTYDMFGTVWGRCETGWVRTTRNILFEGYTLLAHSFTATVTSSDVNVRTGPTTSYSKISVAYKGEKLQIVVLIVIDSDSTWGLSERGWVSLVHTDYDSSKLSYYQNHSYGDWSKYSDPTCTEQGQNRRDCAYCDHYEIQLTGFAPHTYGQWEDTVAGTCVQQGQQQRTCADCGHKETRTTGLGTHNCGQWQTVTAATCTQPGRERRDCVDCDYYETQLIPTRDHNYGAWYVTLEPTDLTVGQSRRDCTHCDHYEIRTLAAAGHSLGAWQEVKAPTCAQEGQERRNCANCDYYENRSLAKTEHTLGEWTLYQAPTCTQAGQERRTCSGCSHYESRAVTATGHSYGGWYQVTASTYTQEGQKRRDCANCDHYETGTIPCKEQPVVKIYGILTGYSFLRIRSGPGTSYSQAGKLNYGDRVEILEQRTIGSNIWGRIEQGWICLTGYMTLETVTEDPDTGETLPSAPSQTMQKTYATITVSALSIRKGPGTGYERLGYLNRGDRVEILDQKQVGSATWGQYSGGWICLTDYTKLETVTEETQTPSIPETPSEPETPSTPETPSEPDTPATVTKTYGTLTGYSFLRIRSGPGTDYSQAGQLSYGDRVEILEQKDVGSKVWGRIEQGWICLTGYMTLSTVTEQTGATTPSTPTTPSVPDSSQKLYAVVTASTVSIRQGPGTSYERVGRLYYGDRVEVLDQKTVGKYTWVKTQQGWVCLTGYAKLETETSADSDKTDTAKTMTVTAEVLNVRAGAGTSFGIVGGLKKGTKVTILEEKVVGGRTWVRIDQGWVCKDYLA